MNDLDPNILIALAAFAGYLLGSIPWGLVLTRMAGLGDIRKIGSGNIGATNVLRTGHKFLAFLTLILDASKSAVAALIFIQFNEVAGIVAGFCLAGALSRARLDRPWGGWHRVPGAAWDCPIATRRTGSGLE